MSIRPQSTRRDLLKALGVGTAAATLPNWFLEETLDAAQTPEPKSANDKPNVALVGCGGRGTADANEARPFCNIVAVCDVDDRHAQAAAQTFKAKPYKDFRKVLERDDIHAVITATPDHWHTLVNLAALKAGKDIYSEKPLTLTIDEGKRLVEAVRKNKRILQVGSQQRSESNFRLACELVRNGRIGKLREVSVILPVGARGGPFETRPVPKGLDWDMWQGQAPAVDYVEQRCHAMFRYWWEYSGSTLTDWGAHHNDIALWGMGMENSGPVTVSGKPAVNMIPGGYTAYSQYRVEYTYANGVQHHCFTTTDDTGFGATVRRGAGTLHNGVRFDGSSGWIWVTRGDIQASKKDILEEPLGSDAQRLPVSNNHKANFFESIRTRKDPIAPVEAGHRSISVCHLGVMSMRMNRALNWDPEKQQFVNDPDADKWLSRTQRAPYTYDTFA
jgi:myo-inositol 2-dehydrogenase / D-chiro-inositol 1-dehydrogenase